ncbi:MAG: ABC transporter substrate-binding protein [Thaumarchaeota archaeon]|nr:ABC transporter substrate-binding protein [Nitrososphaerota archaeon]MCL5319017.1 ABC transporter substrate-binding protein [Nitrososphaerota archaeon]
MSSKNGTNVNLFGRSTAKYVAVAAAVILVIAGLGIYTTWQNTSPPADTTKTTTKEPALPASTPKSTPQEAITIRYLSSPPFDLWDFANKLGYLKGITLTSVGIHTGGPAAIIAASSGSIDIGGSHLIPIINAKDQGVAIKIIAGLGGNSRGVLGISHDFSLTVLQNSSIQSPKDLVGKKIGVNILGGSAEYFIRSYLERDNIPKDKVQLVVLPTLQAEQALRQGQVDGIMVGAQIFDMILAKGGVKVVFTCNDIVGDNKAQGVLFVSEQFLKEKPEAARRLTEAVAKVIDWTREHPKEARELAINITIEKGGNPDLAKYWNGFGAKEHGLLTDEDSQFWLDWLGKEGIIKEGQLKPSDIYTNEYNPYYKK